MLPDTDAVLALQRLHERLSMLGLVCRRPKRAQPRGCLPFADEISGLGLLELLATPLSPWCTSAVRFTASPQPTDLINIYLVTDHAAPPCVPATWAALLNASSDLLALLDEHGRIVWANAGFVLAVGADLADVFGREAAPAAEAAESWQALDSCLREGRGFDPVELPWRDRAGQLRRSRVFARVLHADERQGAAHALLAMQDTTLFHRGEDAAGQHVQLAKLREDREFGQRLSAVVSAAGVGVWRRHPSQARAFWNDQMFVITGRPPELGGPTQEEWAQQIVHPDDRDAMRELLVNMSPGAAAVEHACRIVRPDGAVRWLAVRVRRERCEGGFSILGIALDVTERVCAEAALRDANERAALAARSIGIGTWEWDTTTGEVIWDEAMFRLRGLAPQSHAPDIQQCLAMTHPDDVESVVRERQEASTGAGPTAHEFRVVWPDGAVHWIASRSTVVSDPNHRSMRRIGMNWDITEAKDIETNRRERELALRDNKAKSEFLSRMSHELRTPLNAVLGFTQILLAAPGTSPDQQRKYLAHVRSAGEHLLALIDDVLALSILDSDRFKLDIQAVPLADVVNESLPLVERLAQSRGVTVRAVPIDGACRGDRTRLRQVMVNLLSNAIKYTHTGGHVLIAGGAENDQVFVQVNDTGRGMSSEQLAHLFEPFNRLGVEREGIEGTGIGLAVVKALVERMGGAVNVASEPGVGSSFEVRLPRACMSPDQNPSVRGEPVLDVRMRSGTVLYIEDNPANVLVLKEIIRMRPGLHIESAPSGAVGAALAGVLRPDLILVDIRLPDMDGFEVVRLLKAQAETAETPCIALSASVMPADIKQARQAGFVDYWTKPINLGDVLASLDQRFPPV